MGSRTKINDANCPVFGACRIRPDSSSPVVSMFLLDIKGYTLYTFSDEKRNKRTTRQIKRSDWFLCLNE